jgi:hypothetical protein
MYSSITDLKIVCAPQVCVKLVSSCTAVYSCVHTSTFQLYKMCTVVQYICTWSAMSVCVFVCPVYMSCVHRSTVHQFKLCKVVQYICTWIYIYKLLSPWVCPVYMSYPFLIHRCGVRGWTKFGIFLCDEKWKATALPSFSQVPHSKQEEASKNFQILSMGGTK